MCQEKSVDSPHNIFLHHYYALKYKLYFTVVVEGQLEIEQTVYISPVTE